MMENKPTIQAERAGALMGYMVEHDERVQEHYIRAVTKHPYFCDWYKPAKPDDADRENAARGLTSIRNRIKEAVRKQNVQWDDLLDCEIWEIFDAFVNENLVQAVDECYDAIAVLLRLVDVIEGRQELGDPAKKEGGAK